MNLKKNIVAAVLGLASTLIGAQQIDIPKEKQENPAGGNALVCAAVGMVEFERIQPNTKEYEKLKRYLIVVAAVGTSAYESQDVFVWKSTAATSDLRDVLDELKNKNYGAYANRRAELAKTKEACMKMYQQLIQ